MCYYKQKLEENKILTFQNILIMMEKESHQELGSGDLHR